MNTGKCGLRPWTRDSTSSGERRSQAGDLAGPGAAATACRFAVVPGLILCSMSAIRELLVGPKATAQRNLADWNAQKLRRVGEDDLLDFTGVSPIHHVFLEMGLDDFM